jgi:pimeloyl-ACP methyl ester carboxylesterase
LAALRERVRRRLLQGLLLTLLAAVGWILGNVARTHLVEDQTPEQTARGSNNRWVQAHDVKLHLTEYGDPAAPLLIPVAGTGAWAGTWVSNVDAMARGGWRVVAIDLPPFGFSHRPATGSYGRRAQALRLLTAIRSLGRGPIVLLGHSYGGGPAAEAAMLEPGLVRHLILIDAAIGLRTAGDGSACRHGDVAAAALLGWRPLRTALVASAGTQPLLTRFWLRQFVARDEVVTEERAEIYRAPLAVRDTSAAIGDWAYQFATARRDADDTTRAVSPRWRVTPHALDRSRSAPATGFATLRMPLTLLWGELDTVTPAQQAREIAAATTNARLLMLPGVGHIPQIEDPAMFDRRLGEVLVAIR